MGISQYLTHFLPSNQFLQENSRQVNQIKKIIGNQNDNENTAIANLRNLRSEHLQKTQMDLDQSLIIWKNQLFVF